MLRAGVAGVGNLGKMHASTLLSLAQQVRLDALADPIEERRSGTDLRTRDLNLELGADETATADSVRSYDDYDPLCRDDELDLVVIAMPSDLHAPAAILAMENGKHVFTEKPMALSPGECRRMVDASRANNRTLMVGHCLRFYPEYVEAERIMRSGEYGRPLSAVMSRYGGRPGGWFADTARSGGVNLDLHIHDVDAALWWWGEPDRVMSRSCVSQEGASSILSQWRYDNGPEVQLEASWDAGSRFAASFRIILEQATLVYGGGVLEVVTREARETVDLSGQMGGHKAELIYCIQCIVDGEPVARCLPEDSALAVSFAACQS